MKQAGKYKNTIDCVKKIYAEEGARAFFKGLEATLWRHGSWNGVYFGCIHGIRTTLPQAQNKNQELLRNFIAGTIGGTLATTANTPFDVVKTRVQNHTNPNVAPKYNWTLPGLATIAREEGFGALYKGYVPKVLRLGPGGGILLVVFDFVSGYLRQFVKE